MTATTILQLDNVSKTYIIGRHKNALEALKSINKMRSKLNHGPINEEQEHALARAELLFEQERFEESYREATGRNLKARKHDRGSIVHALRGIDLKIRAGELVAIMGPSGSGKSTLLNVLGLLDSPTFGRVIIEDQDITAIKAKELPKIRSEELGFVFQAFNLIPTLTALENVMLPLRYSGVKHSLRKSQATDALEKVGLGNRLHHMAVELSGGQQQRVAIARSIVNHPAIILGDELTGELDSKMTEQVMDLIVELNGLGQTFVIVTHNPDVARRCHRVIHMLDGEVDHTEVSNHRGSSHLLRL
jgi:putative ABC transport system ATP-binding protein